MELSNSKVRAMAVLSLPVQWLQGCIERRPDLAAPAGYWVVAAAAVRESCVKSEGNCVAKRWVQFDRLVVVDRPMNGEWCGCGQSTSGPLCSPRHHSDVDTSAAAGWQAANTLLLMSTICALDSSVTVFLSLRGDSQSLTQPPEPPEQSQCGLSIDAAVATHFGVYDILNIRRSRSAINSQF